MRDALNELLTKVREGGAKPQAGEKYDATCDDILSATDRLFNSMGNAGEMVKQAKILAQVSFSLFLFVENYFIRILVDFTVKTLKP